MKNKKIGFQKLSDKEYEFLLEKQKQAKKKGDFKLYNRIKAIILVGYKGMKQKDAALMCEVHSRNLSKWLAFYRSGGYDELSNYNYKGRPARLSSDQVDKLGKIVDCEPLEQGYDGGIWTASMVVEVIFREFGVNYSASRVQRLLRKMGFSFKLPKKNFQALKKQHGISGWKKNCPKLSKK
jgi:transposase